MFNWIWSIWYWQQRNIDIAILWPSIKKQAKSLDMAKAAFATHAFQDAAWLALGEEYIIDYIDGLK